MVATSKEDILAARGVKPCISPNLNVLATVEALQVCVSTMHLLFALDLHMTVTRLHKVTGSNA